MDPSNTRSNNRTVNFRYIIVSGISFFLGLQFSNLTALFQIDLINSDATAWAPDEIFEKPQREISDHDNQLTPKKKRGKRNKGPLPRYHDSNYTKESFEPLPWSLPEPSATRNQTSEEFMADYIAMKRKHKISLPWEQAKYREDKVTLPRPIIGLNFPKSATLTMSEYFKCAGIVSQHTSTQDGRIGICMMENHLADKPPMEGCNTERTQTGDIEPIEVIFDIGLQGPPCYYASVHDGGLENIAKYYPEGTIMLVTRNATKWARSIIGWNGRIMKLWADESCHFDGSLEGEGMEYWADQFESASGANSRQKVQYWIDFYEANTQKIREFALKHLSLTYVEVELENEKMAEQLQHYTGVERSCVQVCHPGPFWIRKHDTTSKCHPPGEEPPEIEDDDVTS